MNCSACGRRGLRSTTTVYMPGKDGELARRRVCVGCAKRSIAILPSERGTRCTCGALAVHCGTCVDKTADKAKRGAADAPSLAKAIRVRARVYEKTGATVPSTGINPAEGSEYVAGIVAGLEQAADYLDGGNW